MDALPNTPIGKSSTNPGDPSDPDTWWREGWGDSLYPEFSLNVPPIVPNYGLPIGILYSVTTSPQDINLSRTG